MNVSHERDAARLVAAYVAAWNEPDPEKRRQFIAEVWIEGGSHVAPSVVAQGYRELEQRIAGTFEKWVRNGYAFRIFEPPVQHHGVVKFRWAMMHESSETPESIGLDIFVLAGDGRAATVYQFIEQ